MTFAQDLGELEGQGGERAKKPKSQRFIILLGKQ